MRKIKMIFCLLFLIFLSNFSKAQIDTTKIKPVEIVSSYKPIIRDVAKINFSGTQLPADTNRSVKIYDVPAQNLSYGYKSISLKPLAYTSDSMVEMGDRNFVRAGFGNYTTPYFKAGLSLGDGSTKLLNIYGDYISSKGKIKYQDFSNLSLKTSGSYFFSGHEVYSNLTFKNNRYFLYGYDHNLFDFAKQDLLQQFQDVDVHVGLRNTEGNNLEVIYNPNVRVNFFSLKDRVGESSYQFNIPVEKLFGESFSVKASAIADLTNYTTKNISPENIRLSNNVIKIPVSVSYYSDRFNIHGGITPAWDNGNFVYLPSIYADYELSKKSLVLQAGWIGDINKNTFRNLSSINPFLQSFTSQKNTRETEYYGGIKSSLGKHFSFNAKAGFVTYRNYQLFINDTSSIVNSKSFLISNENLMYNLKIHGDASYVIKDKFSASAGFTANGYTGLKENEKAWHTVPLEITASLRWWIWHKLLLKSDFYLFAGSPYIEKGNTQGRLSGADLNAGLEYKINKRFSAFVNLNNIFGNSYERWRNYPVYGFNFLGGVVYRFSSILPGKNIQ